MLSTLLTAQELNCEITVNADKITGTNKKRFETLQTALVEFMNASIWTNRNYEVEERIDVNLTIMINQEIGSDKYDASIQVQSRRPIYGTDYYSPIFNYKDTKLQFAYVENQSLDFNEQNFSNNLVSTLAYYSYLIIAMDDDTFKENGGTKYYNKARKVVEVAQNNGYTGWEQGSNRINRFSIVDNLISERYSDARKASYKYHRLGLDLMSKDQVKAKNNIIQSINTISEIAKYNSNLSIVQNFSDAKVDEIVDIFSAGPKVDTEKIKSTLNTMSPANQANWDKIK